MSVEIKRFGVLVGALCLALAVGWTLAAPANAGKVKSIKSEGKWESYDPEAQTITIKIRKSGKKPKDSKLALKKGKEATFNVIAEGSILTRTSVAINGRKGALTDIEKGKSLIIYWQPDAKNEGDRFARKIDVVMSREEWLEKYPESK
jgi:hypothetical protein